MVITEAIKIAVIGQDMGTIKGEQYKAELWATSAHNGTGRETEDGEKLRKRTRKSSWYKPNMRTSGRSDSAERSSKK